MSPPPHQHPQNPQHDHREPHLCIEHSPIEEILYVRLSILAMRLGPSHKVEFFPEMPPTKEPADAPSPLSGPPVQRSLVRAEWMEGAVQCEERAEADTVAQAMILVIEKVELRMKRYATGEQPT